MAKRSFRSSLTYSNCTYPFVLSKRLSTLSLPQIWTTWKSSSSWGRASLTSLLTPDAPRLPPMTMMTGFPSEKWHISKALNLLPFASSVRIGEPVRTALSAGRSFMVSGKLQQTLAATGMHSLLASPGVISDSCMMQGILRVAAALTTGTLTNPPLLNITSGFSSFNILWASANPFNTRKGSLKFLWSK